ncbi:MAG: hypothetical protein ACRDHZ_07130, partial [Ktedonobacteraceae bacterium]
GEEIIGLMRQWLVVQKLRDDHLVALSVGSAGRVDKTLLMTSSIQQMETWLQEQKFEQWICTTIQWSMLGIYRRQSQHIFS